MNKITVFYDHIRNACIQTGLPIEEIAEKLRNEHICGTEIEYEEIATDEGARLAKQLSDLGLPISSVYCHFRWELDKPLNDSLTVLKRLSELDIHYLLAIPGFKKAGQSSLASRQELLPHLSKLCEMASEYDIQVLMEDYDDSVVCFGTAKELEWFMTNEPKLGCAFDTGNFFYFDEDALTSYEYVKRRIKYVHCKDRSTTPVSSEMPKLTIGGTPMYSSAVGSGVIPMTMLLDNILKAGYDGPLAIEHFGSPNQLEDMISSAKYIQTIITS